MRAKLIPFSVAVLIAVSVLFSIAVFWTYGVRFGPISSMRDDWSAFGSLLSGVFALLSAVATVSTLILLFVQLQKQQESVIFEQYITHRKLFFERLDELEKTLNITFKDRDQFYQCIFPRNRPGVCFTHEAVQPVSTRAKDISDCCSLYTRIGVMLSGSLSGQAVIDLLMDIDRIRGKLHFLSTEEKYLDGEVFFHDIRLRVSILAIESVLRDIETVLNSILFFSGNKSVDPISHKVSFGLKYEMYDVISRPEYSKVFKLIFCDYSREWFELYMEFDRFRINGERVLPDSFVFAGHVVTSLCSPAPYSVDLDRIVEQINEECEQKKREHFQRSEVDRINDLFRCVLSAARAKRTIQ